MGRLNMKLAFCPQRSRRSLSQFLGFLVVEDKHGKVTWCGGSQQPVTKPAASESPEVPMGTQPLAVLREAPMQGAQAVTHGLCIVRSPE